MAWNIEFTDEFGDWWEGLSLGEQESVRVKVELLAELGPALTRPHADTIPRFAGTELARIADTA